MKDESTFLEAFKRTVGMIEDIYHLQLLSLALLYERVAQTTGEEVEIKSDSMPYAWRPPMAKDDVMRKAPTMVGSTIIHGAVMLYGALDYYLFRICSSVYLPNTTDRSYWRSPGVIQAITGVEPETCLKWKSVVKLATLYDQFTKAEDATWNERPATITQTEFTNYIRDAAIFAEDFERAVVIKHPKVRLP